MKKTIIFLMLLVANLTFANGNEPHKAKLNLSLNLDKLCDETAPFCNISRSVSLGGIELYLTEQDGETICTDDECTTVGITHYRGIWSKVVETDGVRSIAIVSIDKHVISSDDPNDNADDDLYSYTIEAEILGDKGLEAKLRLSTDDLKKLNGINLYGKVKTVFHSRYQASLFIGPAMDIMPIPCTPDNDTCGDIGDIGNDNKKHFNNDIQLLLGTLK